METFLLRFPVTFSRRILNSGNQAVAAGYAVTENIERLILRVAGGSAAFLPGPPTQSAIATCTQLGPALPPGGSAIVNFTLPGPGCTPGPALVNPNELQCSMYRETLTIDAANVIAESEEQDNVSRHFFFVPSQQPRVNIATVLNPTNDPDVNVIPVRRIQILAPNLGGGPGPVTKNTHRVTINTSPPGGTFTVNPKQTAGPMGGSRVGTALTVAPVPPMGVLTAPRVFNLNVAVVPNALSPGPNRGDGLYEENYSFTFTVFSEDGCQLRQEILLVTVIHEAL